MTPMRLDTILGNLDLEERGELISRIVNELTHHEIMDALVSVWSRVEPRVKRAYGEYIEERGRIDAEIAADRGDS